MDNFQAIGQLVIKAQDLLDSIKGGAIRVMQTQFDALKVQFTDKLILVNTELAAFVNQQKSQVNSIFSEPDSRYQKVQPITFKIEGDDDKFYPVVFNSTDVNRLTEIHIGRYITGDSGEHDGAVYAKFTATSSAWGGRSSTMLLDMLKTKVSSSSTALVQADGFIGSYHDSYSHPNGCVVWLRGGYTYEFTSVGSNLSDVIATTQTDLIKSDDSAVIYLNGYNHLLDGKYQNKIDILTARNTTLVPEFVNYERA